MRKNLKKALLDKNFVELLKKLFSAAGDLEDVLTLEDWQKFLETAKVKNAKPMVCRYLINAWMYPAEPENSESWNPSRCYWTTNGESEDHMCLTYRTIANKIEIGYEYRKGRKAIKYFRFYLGSFDELLILKA